MCRLEENVVIHCAPTLAGLNTGNLFNQSFTDVLELIRAVNQLNDILNAKDVSVTILRISKGRALIYVFRRSMLEQVFRDGLSRRILIGCGYSDFNCTRCVITLIARIIAGNGFPHEIGLFLGYPAEDVQGFIREKGKNCKCCGLWKVYSDPFRAEKLFRKFNKCTRVYRTVLKKGGTDIEKLAV